MEDKSFDALVEQFLGKRPPPQMAEAISFPGLRPDSQDFIMRMLALMKRSGHSATEFTPAFMRWLSSIPSLLPSAWGGRIPPLTLPGRHKKLDEYVAKQNLAPGDEPPVFVDVGCGFPPVTTADTARRLTDWKVFGVDCSFADYVLYDAEGHYACFDQEGGFQYFQALMSNSGRALYADPKVAKDHFRKLFADIFPLLQNSDDAKSETVEKDGNRLIHNHLRDFETDNLTFIKSDIEKLRIRKAKVIRCMNMLIYFAPEIRKKMLLQIARLLDDDGVLIAGTNGLGIQFRYAVYQKEGDSMFPKEFAFSPDNLGPITFMPWFTIHENDPEAVLLADLLGAIHADRSFQTDFSSRVDALLQDQGICQRGNDGFLHFPQEISPSEYFEKNAAIWQQIEEEGYPDGAVNVLERAGYEAWKNPMGDIAIRPL